jgi:tripartite-type tricarboxylate transporter receptor subunit TctC
MPLWRRSFVLLSIVVMTALTAQAARPETMRTIKIVVPNPPAATTDILARLLAEQIERSEGATIVVENRPGAGNIVGSEAVAHAAPDGNTLLINATPFVIDPHLHKLSYDPFTSFEPICYLANSPTIIVVNSASPYRTLADLINVARAKPGTVTMAAVGPRTTGHMAFELLKHAADVDMTFIPYPGNPPAVTAVLGGYVDAAITGYPVAAELLKSGKLRALATTTPARIERLPDLPTVAEFGYSGYGVEFWMGVVAPAKTPPDTISLLSRWFAAALQTPETKTKLVVQGIYPVGSCEADFAAFIRKQYDDYGRIIQASNIKAE